MKILMVSDSIFPDNIGGSYKYLFDLTQELVKKNDVSAIVSDKKNLASQENIGKVKIFRYKRNRKNKIFDFYSFYKGAKDATAHFNSSDFDVIHFHWPLPALGVLRSKKLQDAKKIYTFHGPWPEEYCFEIQDKYPRIFIKFLKWFFGIIEKNILKKMDKIICASEFMRNKLIELYGKDFERKIIIIPIGINLGKYQKIFLFSKNKARERLNLPTQSKIIFTARRLYKRMGLENLIEAFGLFIKKNPDAFLLIAGKGPEKQKLEEISHKLKLLSKIKFLGFVDEEKLPLYYRAVDVFVLPTIKLEGFGLVILESFAIGCPVLGTPVGAIPEVLENFDRSFILKSTRPEDIAGGIEKFFNQKEKTKSIFNKADNFDISKTAKEIENVYKAK